jgi:hypothetical protein
MTCTNTLAGSLREKVAFLLDDLALLDRMRNSFTSVHAAGHKPPVRRASLPSSWRRPPTSGTIGRDFWVLARDDRLQVSDTRRLRRFHQILDEEYQCIRHNPAGPPNPALGIPY